MRIDGRHYRDEWLPNFYPGKKIGDRIVRVSRTGRTVVLTPSEDAQINEFFMATDLFERLERTGHIITSANASTVFHDLSTWLKGTYDGPGLHIVIPTRRCNLNCTYCHMYPQPMEALRTTTDLQSDTIPYIARFIMDSPRNTLCVEFQGGEPFLNFPGMIQTIDEIRKLNTQARKDIRFEIVSNLMVVTDEHLSYCKANNIGISYTLNGPQNVHDLFRITRTGAGSYNTVVRRLDDIRARFPGVLAPSPLCVVTDDNIRDLKSMVRYFHEAGFTDIGILTLKNLGNARGHVYFNMHEYIPHYIDLLDYLYVLNKDTDAAYSERIVRLALMKIFGAVNPLFIDWRNPIGYVSNAIVYDWDGEILPVDEARSFRDVFTLGNVRSMSYDQLIRRNSTFDTVNLSIRDRDPTCRECAYNPYCGVSPVLHYSRTGRLAPEPHVSHECILIIAVFDWIFRKMLDDPLPLLKMAPEVSVALAAHLSERATQDFTVCAT